MMGDDVDSTKEERRELDAAHCFWFVQGKRELRADASR